MRGLGRKKAGGARLLGALLCALGALLLLSVRWLLDTWQHLSMDEVVYHLTSSLSGADPAMVADYLLWCLAPAAGVFLLLALCLGHLRRPLPLGAAALAACLALSFFWLDARVQIVDFLKAQQEDSDFIARHYVSPEKTKITFPQDKRNLVYIYLESVETTFADPENGGGMPKNLIPNLTKLAQAHEDFSGSSDLLGGAHVPYGATWTMGAMFAHTAGLPLKVAVEGNSMGEQAHFFPGAVTLGDVLEDAGYQQTLLIGSDAAFGGRGLYFGEHGHYAIKDYGYAQREGWIDPEYFVFWGYEDEKLFDFAREELGRLSAQEQPFHLSILTVDTHFEDGYVCARCGTAEEEQYANVMLCADCQVTQFVAWLQQQPYYADTAVVIAGDHLTMDSDFCSGVSKAYDRRVYTAFLNAVAVPKDASYARSYSTFDLFPTTLAALGAEIEGNRLALGVNLFSEEKTLFEEYGAEALNSELRKNSSLMRDMAQLFVMKLSAYDAAANTMQLYVEGLDLVEEESVRVEAVRGDHRETLYETRTKGKKTLSAAVTLPETLLPDMEFVISYVAKDGTATPGGGFAGHPLSTITKTTTYLDTLAKMPDCSLLFAVKGDAGLRMTKQIDAALHTLGLQESLIDQYSASYCAVITGGKTEEKMDLKPLKMNDKLHDGIKYRLISAGYEGGNRVSIRVDGEEYAADYRGLNLVVYHHGVGQVIDSLSIDTNEQGDIKRRKE